MLNTIKTISLTDNDKTYLNKLLNQSTLEIRIYQRAKILLLKSNGVSDKDTADKLDIGIGVVKRCLNKFKKNGVEAALGLKVIRINASSLYILYTTDGKTWIANAKR